jgi:CrcB protein
MTTVTWVAVAALGSVAAVSRFLVGGWIAAHISSPFPLGTLVVNLSGALLLGLVAGVALSGNALVLVGAATIGSYTTFSTWMLETHRLNAEGQTSMAVANVMVSIVLGVLAVALGRAIGGWL